MSEQQLVCTVCGTTFPFTAEEQEFYQSKGFQPPKKCKPCRDEAKRNRGGGGYGGGGYDRPRRELHDAVCAACGINTQVPFLPTGEKPVYCRDCYQQARA